MSHAHTSFPYLIVTPFDHAFLTMPATKAFPQTIPLMNALKAKIDEPSTQGPAQKRLRGKILSNRYNNK